MHAYRSQKLRIFQNAIMSDIRENAEKLDQDMTKYVFTHTLPPVIICLMQLCSAMIVESINMTMLSGRRNVYFCISNFVAIIVISEVDNIYLDAMMDPVMSKIMASGTWQPKIVYRQVRWKSRSAANKMLFMLYLLIKRIYACGYFYFFPFLVFVFN